MNRFFKIVPGFFLFTLLMGSCINDDLSNCTVERYLHFETLNKKYNFKDIVEKVDLYIYDGDELINTKTYSRTDIQATDYKIPLYGYPGKTKLHYIALVNQSETCYHTINTEQKKDLLTEILPAQGDSVKNRLSNIFHGAKYIDFDYSTANTSDTIYLKKNTNNINLFVSFDGYELPENNYLKSFISGSNGKYDYENTPITDTKYTYLPYNSKVNDKQYAYTSQFTTMRLWIGADTEIKLEKEDFTGSPVITESVQKLNITEVLAKIVDSNKEYLYNTNEKLEKEDEYNIFITLDGSFVIMDLTINNWFVIKGGVGL